MIFYASILRKRLLLRNVSKIGCQFMRICHNKCVTTFWRQKSTKDFDYAWKTVIIKKLKGGILCARRKKLLDAHAKKSRAILKNSP